MSKTVSVQEAARRLGELLTRVRQGEDVVIAQDDEPIARLVTIPRRPRQPRQLGGYEGRMRIADDFDAPLPDDFWLGRTEA